mgnify:FL=1
MRHLLRAAAYSAAITFLLFSSAFAADMTPAQRAAATKAYAADPAMFAGFYVGGHGGWTTMDLSINGNTLATADGFVYGGHVGFQVQKGWLVGGLEFAVTNFAGVKFNGTGCECLVADILAKIGVAVTPQFMIYVHGGGFFHNTANVAGLVPDFGWAAGAGVDWLPINNHWVIGSRYTYRSLGDSPKSSIAEVAAHQFDFFRAAYKF